MPYAIRKIGPDDKPYCVVNTETDENHGCSATEADAKKHLAVLNMREHGIPPEEKAEGEQKESTMVEEQQADDTQITLPKEYLDRLQGISAQIQKVTGDSSLPSPDLPPVEKADNEETVDETKQTTEYTCECLDCNHTFTTEEHCADATCPECGSENCRRQTRPGVGQKDTTDDVEQYLAGIDTVFPGAAAIEKATGEQDQLWLDFAKKAAEGPVPLNEVLALYRRMYGEGMGLPPLEEKAEGEREKLQSAAEARAKKYNIGVKEGGNRTPPKGYPTEEGEYGDPVNYRYPADASHARAALGYFNHSGQREAGGYTSSEWAIIGKRLARLISRHLTGSYTYSNGKLQQTESKTEEKDVLTQMKVWVKDIWDKLMGNGDDEPTITPLFVTKEMEDGSHRWIKVSSTAFRDRESEIVSTEGIAKSIARADESGAYGPLLFWHTPASLGTCDFQAQDGVCLVESGLWNPTPAADAARKSIDASPSNWGVSIGFLPLAKQEGVIIKGAKVNRIWTDLQIVERSILPSSQAASLFTQSISRGNDMEQKKKDALLELLGNDEDLVQKVLSATEDINQKANDPDAVFKDTDTPPEGEQVEPTEETEPTEDTELTELEEKDADLLIMLKSLREQVETLSTQVTALKEAQEAPRALLRRPTVPSQADDDDLPTEDAETKDTGTPRAVSSITSKLLGG